MRTYASTPRYKPPLIEEIHSHEDIQKALWDGEGDVKAASAKLGCAQSTLYDYMDRNPEAKAVKDEAKKYFRRAKVEEREKLLYAWQEQKKNAPVSFAAIKYYLDTHGKDEGWGKDDEAKQQNAELALLKQLLQNAVGAPKMPESLCPSHLSSSETVEKLKD